MESQNLDIQLLGQKIPVKTDGDPELVDQVVGEVSRRILTAEGRVKGALAPHKVAILALLDLAEDYVRARRDAKDTQDELIRRSNQLIEMIDAEMQPGAPSED